VLALALGFGGLIARLAHAWRSGEADRGNGRCLVALWALASAGLFSIYVGQELLEGLFASGHPQGLVGILGDGGLWGASGVGGRRRRARAGGLGPVGRSSRVCAGIRHRARLHVRHSSSFALTRWCCRGWRRWPARRLVVRHPSARC